MLGIEAIRKKKDVTSKEEHVYQPVPKILSDRYVYCNWGNAFVFSLKVREQVKVKWRMGSGGLALRGQGEGGGESDGLPGEWGEHQGKAGRGHSHVQGMMCAP